MSTLGEELHDKERYMGDKSPKNTNAKKPAKSVKEKRAAKNEKRRGNTTLGSR
jgi:hypothetical protein